MLRLCLEWWWSLPDCRRQSLKRRFYATLLSLILAALLNLGYSETYAKDAANRQASAQLLPRFGAGPDEIEERSVLMQFREPQLTRRPPENTNQEGSVLMQFKDSVDKSGQLPHQRHKSVERPSDASHSENRHSRSRPAKSKHKTSFPKAFLKEERKKSWRARAENSQWSTGGSSDSSNSVALFKEPKNKLLNILEDFMGKKATSSWNCAASWPVANGTDMEKCQKGNSLSNGIEYLYNSGATSTVPGACGIPGCWCCSRYKTCTSNLYLNPPESARTYSSVYESSAGKNDQSMLDSPLAWSANAGSQQAAGEAWMTLDIGHVTKVMGVATQSRADKPWEYVDNFTALYSSDGSAWQNVSGMFVGSSDTSKVVQYFPDKVDARYVKIVPQGWSTWISMRAGVVLCQADLTSGDLENVDNSDVGNWTVISATAACEENNEGVTYLSHQAGYTLESCKSKCVNTESCTAIDFYNATSYCLLYSTACVNALSIKDGSSSYRLTRSSSGPDSTMFSSSNTTNSSTGNTTNASSTNSSTSSDDNSPSVNETNSTNGTNEMNISSMNLTSETQTLDNSSNVTSVANGTLTNVSNLTITTNETASFNESNISNSTITTNETAVFNESVITNNETLVKEPNITNGSISQERLGNTTNGTSTNITSTANATTTHTPTGTNTATGTTATTTTNKLPYINEDAPKKSPSLLQWLESFIEGGEA